MTDRDCLFSETLAPGMRSSVGQYVETVTMKSGPVELFTTTRLSGSTSFNVPIMSGGLFSLSSSVLILARSFCSLNSSLSVRRFSFSAVWSSSMSLTFFSSNDIILALSSDVSSSFWLLSMTVPPFLSLTVYYPIIKGFDVGIDELHNLSPVAHHSNRSDDTYVIQILQFI